jgi:predicted CopG family antitoxin
MASANDHIRISEKVKKMLDRRKREGESYNDVVERLLSEQPDPDFYDGFGRWSNDEAERVRTARRETKEKQKDRMHGRTMDSE